MSSETETSVSGQDGPPGLLSLTDDVLVTIFRIIESSSHRIIEADQAGTVVTASRQFCLFRRNLSAVSRRFRALLKDKYPWSTIFVSVAAELETRRQDASKKQSASAFPGSSPSATPPSYGRPSLRAQPGTLRSSAVVAWLEARPSGVRNLVLDLR
jgi:hypothetical protein